MRPIALVAFAFVLSVAVSASQSTPVTGARAFLVKKERRAFQVTIENRRDSMLVEVEVEAKFVRFRHQVAVGPHERRMTSMQVRDDATPASPRVVYAAFADGTAEGERRPVQERVKDWQTRLDDLGYWVRAFLNMPHVSSIDVRRFLVDRIAERSVVDRLNVPHVSDRIRALLRQYPNGADLWMPLDDLRRQIEAELTGATSIVVKPAAVVDAVTSAAIVSSAVVPSAPDYAAVVENLRDIPIEALAIEQIDSVSGGRRGGRTMDFCLSSSADGRGRIQPHERREDIYPIYSNGALPELKVSFVLFDDQSFEGSPAVRDDLFRRREDLADEDAFGVEILKTAGTKAPGEIERFLLNAKIERSRQLQLAGKESRPLGPLDEALRMFRESPSTFAERVPGYRASLENAIQQLRRHLPVTAK
jgi:hypothetical protein